MSKAKVSWLKVENVVNAPRKPVVRRIRSGGSISH